MQSLTIISGGQTGVDRGALDAALDTDTPCGGWCPKNRRAEDGRVPDRYPLQETDSEEYDERTRRNIEDTDGTLIIHFGTPSGGTELTARLCSARSKPVLMLDADRTELLVAEQQVFDFLRKYSIRRLNVAGPRSSKQPYAHDYAYRLLLRLLRPR